MRSFGLYDGSLKNAIQRLKYRRDLGLGEALAQPLGVLYHETGWRVDQVVPIPLGQLRFRSRGYNQASLLALPFALANNISYEPKTLVRIRETQSQVGLSREMRRSNVAEAFRARPELARGKAILLVDDVTTTGSTLNEAAKALLAGGAQEVYCLTLARVH